MPLNKINKRILILVSLFFFLNIGLLYVYLNRVDKKYSVLFEKGLENFKYIQRITEISNKTFFTLSEMLDTKDTNEINKLKQERLFLISQNTKYYDSIVSSTIIDTKVKEEYADIVQFRRNSFNKVDVFFNLIKTQSNDSCLKYFYAVLTPNYLKYQNKLEIFTDAHIKDMLNNSQNISNNVKRNSNSVLLFGFSPLILVLISAFVYLLLIIIAIFLFKWKPIEFD